MGVPVLILGRSGSGKSCSMRKLNPDETVIYNIASKPLPFKNNFTKVMNNNVIFTKEQNTVQEKLSLDSNKIVSSLRKNVYKLYVIDDSQYLMAFEGFEKAYVLGYEKFTQIASNFWRVIRTAMFETSRDTIVYFLHHSEIEDGVIKPKTFGKMVDNQLNFDGLFSIVLMAQQAGDRYVFQTRSKGADPCKAPMGMFDEGEIDNDLAEVDARIRAFYELEKGKENLKLEETK